MIIQRGDIYYADLRPVVGSEQGGIRPVLIIQNDVGNRHSPTVICAAITSQMHKAKLPTHVELPAADCQLVDADEMARAVRRLFLAVAEIRDTPRSSGDAAAKETQEREGRHRRRPGKAARDLQHRQPS